LSILKTVLKEDLSAATEAFDRSDFTTMNILANRFMGNTVFDDSLLNYCVIGFFAKNVSLDFLRIQADEDLLKKKSKMGKTCLAELKKSLEQDVFSPILAWNAMFKYKQSMRETFTPESERGVYSENVDFVNRCFGKLTSLLKEEQEVLLMEQNLFLSGILNEMDRITRSHGMNYDHFAFFNIITAFEKLYRYLWYSAFQPNGIINREKLQRDISPYIDQIVSFREENKEEAEIIATATTLISTILVSWRIQFILFMEIGLSKQPEQKRVELPEEAKKRIMEIITQDMGKT
jgi:hypothetical protein